MGFNFDYNYKIKHFYVGFTLKDTVVFNQIFSNASYLQRVQSVTPYAKTQLHKRVDAKASLAFENTRTTSLDTGQAIDHGNNVVGTLGFHHNLMEKKYDHPSGIEQSLTFIDSFQNLGGDYNYASTEYSFLGVLQLFGDRYIEYKLFTSVPLNSDHRPLSSLYWAGGYKLLRGYDSKEFSGEAIISQRLSYNVPLSKVQYNQVLGINYAVVTWDVAMEAVEIGTRDIFYTEDTLKLSAEVGLGYRVIVLKYLPLKFEFVVAKALEARLPKPYVLVSTTFYSWSSY
jgi:outer membrane protein assembly factor BamA